MATCNLIRNAYRGKKNKFILDACAEVMFSQSRKGCQSAMAAQ
jgi:hypothetical protein